MTNVISGQCGVCHKNLSNGGTHRDYVVIPYEGKMLLVCQPASLACVPGCKAIKNAACARRR